MIGDPFEEGSWVRVWARVAEQRHVHPDDLVVNLQSHNADHTVEVRRDRVTPAEFEPAWAEQCPSLKVSDRVRSPSEYLRCTRVRYHDSALKHYNGSQEWAHDEADGNMEDS